jgi:hypothetical protein
MWAEIPLSISRIEQPRKHTRRQPESHPAHCADRAPDEAPAPENAVHFAEFKLLLKPDELRHIVDAYTLWTHVYRAVDRSGVRFVPTPGDPPIRQRDIMFYDTPQFDLYENHFILRRRTHYRDGWTKAHDELTFKFRHPDVARVRGVDVRPKAGTAIRVKFKREILPLPDQIGGSRHIYTRNCVMVMPPPGHGGDVDTLLQLFPALNAVRTQARGHVALVNQVTVNETLSDFGVLDFGHGLAGTVNLALWRDTETSAAIVSELGFQLKFDRLDERTEARLEPIEAFFQSVQHRVARWLFLGTTKTNLVYRRRGREVQNRE